MEYKKSIIICTAVFTVIVTVIFSLAINAMVVKKNVLESDKVVTVCVKIGKINSREFEGHITESNDIFNAGDRISVQYKIIQKALVDNFEESQVGNTVEVSIAKTTPIMLRRSRFLHKTTLLIIGAMLKFKVNPI